MNRREEWLERLLEFRNVDTPCKGCGGAGVKGYANTSTWNHGIGGQMCTSDVCDKCWGSGDANRTWTDLRKLQSEQRKWKADLKAEREKAAATQCPECGFPISIFSGSEKGGPVYCCRLCQKESALQAERKSKQQCIEILEREVRMLRKGNPYKRKGR